MIDPQTVTDAAETADEQLHTARRSAAGVPETADRGVLAVVDSNLAIAEQLRALRLALPLAVEQHARAVGK